ncbi:NACHT, LRR and PYD domains-containing protein 1 homolog isoform X2 [Clupea harengus]|uniref:NACHT, LRR and PYD domains-containing protein 1 homolog isoform X2 n=1 Tax=Clupea harengus TaxID=7950 RepID=A0A8M1KDD1_CLUHA|nr:NACHT, LRR and PYD domains-containing protein 1 homolog isoform X2 [Clupea harengus]
MPDQQQTSQLSALFRAATLHDLHTTAVDLALQSKNGHLDLFLRFLLGLSLESNQNLLSHLLPQTRSQSQSSEQTAQCVKQKIRDQNKSDRKINLFYCLNELNHHAVVEDIDRSSGTLCVDMLLPGKWETKIFEFKIPKEQLDEFDLQKYIKTPEEDLTELLSLDEVLQKLVPVVTYSTSAVLYYCDLTEKSCSYLASALTSHSSSLTQLNLGFNELLGDSGVELLCSALSHQNCKLEELLLINCDLTQKSCSYLASALISHSSSLTQLDLGGNRLSASDVEQLSALVNDPNYKLETLIVDGRIFRRESPAAAAASASSSHSSDAAELHLTDKTQQDPGAQLLSDDTPNDDPQRSCKSCAEVPDTSHWVLVEPEVSTEKSVSTYSLSSPAGSYECSESGLRWSCAGPVTLQYRFTDWHVYAEELAHMQYRPAGPLMDISLMSGELEEIHLPHFLCLGGCEASVCDAVRVLHGRDSGVCVEVCELTRRHARLAHPSFSPRGVIYYLKSLLFPISVHSEVLVYQSSTSPLVFHTYLLPEDAHLRQRVERVEEKLRGVWVPNPQPIMPLQMDGFYSLMTDCTSKILPEKLMLRYSKTTPNFIKVKLPEAAASFHMVLFSSADSRGQSVWTAELQSGDDGPLPESRGRTRDAPTEVQPSPAVNTNSGDYLQPSRSPGQVGRQEAADFVDDNRAELISRVTEVMPIADELLDQRVIGRETYSNIQAAPTSEDKMRVLYEGLHSAGAQGKSIFYRILQAQQPLLVEDL